MAAQYILSEKDIALKMRRMALEIAERNMNANHIILAGIANTGIIIIHQLQLLLKEFYAGTVELIEVNLNKKHPGEVTLSHLPNMENAVVILADDVANSGRTLTYALKPFLHHLPQKIQTLALVNRTHKLFPIQPDYVGCSLATTLQEYIEVEVKEGVLTGAWMA